MYLNCRIKIPDTGGKITIKFVSGTSYVYLEQTQTDMHRETGSRADGIHVSK